MRKNGQTVAHEASHKILIIKGKSEIEYLATNQGVVGSNPAGRANNQIKWVRSHKYLVLLLAEGTLQGL